MNLLFWAMIALTVIVVYVFWVRPLLKQNPALHALFATEETMFAAYSAKFSGIKQRLTHALILMATSVVGMYDYIAPKLTGIDVTPLTSHVPNWAWPIATILGVLLLDRFRKIADDDAQAKIAAVAPPAPPAPPSAPGA